MTFEEAKEQARKLQQNKERAVKMTLRQFRYIKFLDQSWKPKCLLKQKPYPKHYVENPNGLEKPKRRAKKIKTTCND